MRVGGQHACGVRQSEEVQQLLFALISFILDPGGLQNVVKLSADTAQRVERVAGILRYEGDLLTIKTGQGSVVCQNIRAALKDAAAAGDIIRQDA